MEFDDSMTIGEARKLLGTLIDKGVQCPCCTQHAKVYRRNINSKMARTLIRIYKKSPIGNFIHVPSLDGDNHEASQLEWWGLLIEEKIKRSDGGRAGWWAITDLGKSFVLNSCTLPKYALIYDGVCLGTKGESVNITACLGKKFKYDELMNNHGET